MNAAEQQTVLKSAQGLVSLLTPYQKALLATEILTDLSSKMDSLQSDARENLLGVIPPVPVAQATIQESDPRAAMVKTQGGIFIGKAELVRLGKIKNTDVVPEIPEKYSSAFLESTHPLRGGNIASHSILGFDVESQQWFCIDRGEGGKSDIVPGSLGPKSQGLSGNKQDALLLKDGKLLEVSGCKIESPKDSDAVERVLDAAIDLHLKDGKPIETAPFRGIYGRTADTDRGASGCRVLLGHSHAHGVIVSARYPGDHADDDVGLLAAWN